ncbi:MAG: DUF5123 domain-containing protein [Prevotella sp.]|nr:DUF5123 domain-containing protein [Prevotella sp.]
MQRTQKHVDHVRFARQARLRTPEVNFAYNTYWFNGAPETEGFSTSSYDKSGNALQSDPAFVDAEDGNFTPTGAEQVARKTGDPRWWNN